jgi:hypothetical protein
MWGICSLGGEGRYGKDRIEEWLMNNGMMFFRLLSW